MEETSQKIIAELKFFDSNHDGSNRDFDALQRALEVLLQANWRSSSDPGPIRTARREMLVLWLSVLQHIEKEIDPQFDQSDLPELNAAPPTVAGQPFDSGMSPANIKDPEARRQYEEAIEANHRKVVRYNFQINIQKWDHIFIDETKKFIRSSYSRHAGDEAELSALVDKYISDHNKAEALKKSAFGNAAF
jgi:hypothetical protein